MSHIACSRMYNVTGRAAQSWNEIFGWIGNRAGIALETIAHAPPEPLEALWSRTDNACVFMCGWPFTLARPQPKLVVAPVLAPARYQGRPIYFTDLVVRRDQGFATLADTFGGRIAWTHESSHSGFNALRHHLLPYRTPSRPRLFRDSVGPLLSPTRSLASVVDGDADVAPMDSFVLDLMRLHEPERLVDIAIIDTTAPAPIPPLVASPKIADADLRNLQTAFACIDKDPDMTAVLADLGLKGFAIVTAEDYRLAETWAKEARDAGYRRPE